MHFLEVLTCEASVLLTLSLWSHQQHKQCCSAAGKSPSNCYLRLTNQMPAWRSASYSSEDISFPGEINQNAWHTDISTSLLPCKCREAPLASSFPSPHTWSQCSTFIFQPSLPARLSCRPRAVSPCRHRLVPSPSCTGLRSPASHQVPRDTVLQSKSNTDHQIKVEPLKQSFHCVVCPYEPSGEVISVL